MFDMSLDLGVAWPEVGLRLLDKRIDFFRCLRSSSSLLFSKKPLLRFGVIINIFSCLLLKIIEGDSVLGVSTTILNYILCRRSV